MQVFKMFRIALITGLSAVFLTAFNTRALAADEILDSDKVLLLMVFDSHCTKWCGQVRPMLHDIKAEFGDKIALYELDFSEKELKTSTEKAKQLGVSGFVKDVIDWIPTVGIFTPKRRLVAEFPGIKKKQVYIDNIQKALKN